jgi:tetratricopeptide (TPR) repeat protein
MGRFEDSIESYEKAIQIEPSFAASYIGIANNLIFLDRPADARLVLQRLEAVATSTAEHRLCSSWTIATYLDEGDFAGALGELEKRLQSSQKSDDKLAAAQDLNMEGDILRAAGRYSEAAAAYARSMELIERSEATDDIKASARRNVIAEEARVALARGDLDLAERLIEEHHRAIAGRGDLFEQQRAYELAGRLALAKGEPKRALFELAKANQQDPRVLILNAQAFAAAGDRTAARAACEEVVHLNQISLPLAFVRKPARNLLREL